MTDAYQLRLRVLAKVRRLLVWADTIDNSNEAEQARGKAAELAKAHGLDIAALDPMPLSVAAPPPEVMKGMVSAISRAYPGVDDEDYSAYGKKKPGEAKKPYYSDLEDEEIP